MQVRELDPSQKEKKFNMKLPFAENVLQLWMNFKQKLCYFKRHRFFQFQQKAVGILEA